MGEESMGLTLGRGLMFFAYRLRLDKISSI